MSDLIFELGCEELPASAVQRAVAQLASLVQGGLAEKSISFGSVETYATPRRLIVSISDVADVQPDESKRMRGPALRAAFDENGNPSKALEGFCRGQGVDPSTIEKDDEYVWVTKHIQGRKTSEVLAELLPSAIRGLTFDKTMRWGSSRMRFARPIRWILAVFGGSVVEFEIETVKSGKTSRGHRFMSPGDFEALNLSQLLAGLRERFVEPDAARREAIIREESMKVSNGGAQMSEALVDENVHLTEWPIAHLGEFKPDFISLPTPVLITAMAKHEKFFPVRDSDGKIMNKFVSIRNGGEMDAVKRGNEWVLNNRFNDAQFFYDEDSHHNLDHFLDKTSAITFQEKLGTVRERADRLSKLAVKIAEATGANADEIEYARVAGLYAKADLSTGLVSELASLQGIIGGEYARKEGFSDAVCWAIATQYDLGLNPTPECEGGRTAVRLVIADQLDKLAGFLGIGLVPTGTTDPFGLRRAATTLIEAAWSWPTAFPAYDSLFEAALDLYPGADREGAKSSLAAIFSQRLESLLTAERHDIREAALTEDALFNPRLVKLRVAILNQISGDASFIQAATRPLNIVSAAVKKGDWTPGSPVADPASLQSEEGAELLKAVRSAAPSISEAFSEESADKAAQIFAGLKDPINKFFDTTMVNVDDAGVRNARLQMLAEAGNLLSMTGDLTKLVIE